jgi:hypothetical protein
MFLSKRRASRVGGVCSLDNHEVFERSGFRARRAAWSANSAYGKFLPVDPAKIAQHGRQFPVIEAE